MRLGRGACARCACGGGDRGGRRDAQDERSQHRNKAKAMKLLSARIYDSQRQARNRERSQQRGALLGSGDRSERVRTYNYSQDRITDHRVNVTVHGIDRLFSGSMPDEFLGALQQLEREEILEELSESG